MKRPTKGFLNRSCSNPYYALVLEPSHSPSRNYILHLLTHSEHSPSPYHSPLTCIFTYQVCKQRNSKPIVKPEHITVAPTQPSPTQPSPTHQSPGEEHHFPIPHDSPLHAVHSHGSDEGEKLGLFFQMMKSLKMILPNRGGKVNLIERTEVQKKQVRKEVDEVSTAGAKKGTASDEVPIVSTR
ncbi:hypothetical protein Tco_1266261 [Tanacetum coccineum]